jgi:cell division protein FtsI/penicillin-binding protein 2
MLDNRKFKKRADIIVLSLATWAVICIAMFFYYAVIARDRYIYLGNKLAQREFPFYPERAKIIDENGVVLAWSEKYFDLYYNNLTGSPERIDLIYHAVKKVLPQAVSPSPEKEHSLMLRSLRPPQVSNMEKLVYLYQELQINPRLERKVVDYPQVRALIGQVKHVKGRLVGISGIEKKYDSVLSGAPGKCRIMLDRNKNWVKNSANIQKAIPGRDVKLDLSLEEIRKKEQK